MKTLLTTLLLALSFNSQAALIKLESLHNDYQVGDTVELQLSISHLSTTLGGFFSELSYATEGFSLVGWQFGNGFDDGFGSWQFADHNALAGLLALDDYADPAADEQLLAANQGSGFVLATLQFLVLSAGDFWFSFNPDWSGALSFDNEFVTVNFSDLQLQVHPASTPVPAPATLVLLLAGLLFLGARKR
ncbi:PEP-CTERM sorting domain-containing protein [Alkalimonas collagenimarina]|uniref:PEP-CTERM sorting domain-containing protein n=1 Tax=Alkalimonas collagenimarina TaxID=400390 RepID=A0ABT9GUC1_9GAMM|nr:PEP-CTERM sorting domain-containing protein [Alkalimonas collagenimarina]MDP4534645.1 PEP-CTERM sorting domain-containing protein [Alkalimonas collagenimarina]